jgi:urea transporter
MASLEIAKIYIDVIIVSCPRTGLHFLLALLTAACTMCHALMLESWNEAVCVPLGA